MTTKNNDDKTEKFREAAVRRVNVALGAIRKVGRLATPTYQYDDGQIDKVVAALREELGRAERNLRARKVADDGGFKL